MIALVLIGAGAPTLPAAAGPSRTIPQSAPRPAAAVPFEGDLRTEVDDIRQRRAERASRATHTDRAIAVAALPATPPKPAAPRRTTSAPRQKPASTTPRAAPVRATGDAAAVIAFALAQVGKPYVWAASGPNSYDCSGLVMAAYATVGVSLPHQTGGIVTRGWPVSRSQLQPGDVVFPSSGHVGIYLGNNQMVHAPQTGQNVKVSSVYAFWTARRLL